MNEMTVAIIVGLLSGALGSVLSPIATHFLRRRERKEEREREIHADLRQMIEQRLDECGKQLAAAFRMGAEVRHLGSSPMDAYNRSVARRVDESRDQPRHRWEPYRVTDDRLRGLAEQLHERLHDLDSHLLSIASAEIDRWQAEVSEKEESLREVERQVRLRLDELRW
jgi:hypothetical protein